MVEDAFDYLEANRARILDELIEFSAIPSVSTDPAQRPNMERAAAWTAGKLHDAGFVDVRVLPTAGHPAVYAGWQGAPGAPTLLIYGHYDVQPPDPLEKWVSPPFEPQVRDGRLYGRGVSDDKGPLLIPIKVAGAFFAAAGALPVNVKFLIEGEEEIGSPSLEALLWANRALFAADFALSADGAMWRIDEPSITVASRGLCGVEFALYGANRDLHSGRYGGAVPNPPGAMARLIASLHTVDGRVAVAGFYDAVEELPPAARAEMALLPFDEVRFFEHIGVGAPFGEAGYTTLERLWTRPTLEVNGLWGGYQGPGSKTVIPAAAHAKITCRLVARQDPQDIRDKLVEHLERQTPAGVRLEVSPDAYNAHPYQIPPGHAGLRVARDVLQRLYGKPPAVVRMGGTLPVSALFRRILQIDTVFFSFSTADEDFHAPNEFFRLHRLDEGLRAWALYWQRLGSGVRE